MNKRYDAINIMKFISSILVVIIHISPITGLGEYILTGITARIAVPFFFITTGYFITKEMKYDSQYMYKYILRLIVLYTGWYLIYFSWRCFFEFDTFSIKQIILLIREYLFVGYYQLWYLPSLILSVLFVWYFVKNDRMKILIIVSVFLYLIGLLGDSYYDVINNEVINFIINKYKIIFGVTKTGLCFGVPILTLGAIISKYKLDNRIKNYKFLLIIATILYFAEGMILKLYNIGASRNMYITFIILIPIMFITLLNIKVNIKVKYSNLLKELSLGIYCVHALIIMIVNQLFSFYNIDIGVLNNMVKFLIVIMLSIVITISLIKCKSKVIKVLI